MDWESQTQKEVQLITWKEAYEKEIVYSWLEKDGYYYIKWCWVLKYITRYVRDGLGVRWE